MLLIEPPHNKILTTSGRKLNHGTNLTRDALGQDGGGERLPGGAVKRLHLEDVTVGIEPADHSGLAVVHGAGVAGAALTEGDAGVDEGGAVVVEGC